MYGKTFRPFHVFHCVRDVHFRHVFPRFLSSLQQIRRVLCGSQVHFQTTERISANKSNGDLQQDLLGEFNFGTYRFTFN
jgi:hypothetical protein